MAFQLELSAGFVEVFANDGVHVDHEIAGYERASVNCKRAFADFNGTVMNGLRNFGAFPPEGAGVGVNVKYYGVFTSRCYLTGFLSCFLSAAPAGGHDKKGRDCVN